MNDINVDKLKNAVNKWASSEEGKQAIKDSVQKVKKVTKELQEARQINPEILNKPFTV